MDLTMNGIKQNEVVKNVQTTAKIILLNKKEAYNTLKSVQEYFNRNSKFVGDKPHELDMVKRMNELGFDIK